jgi:hypothetical protein
MIVHHPRKGDLVRPDAEAALPGDHDSQALAKKRVASKEPKALPTRVDCSQLLKIRNVVIENAREV